jgi:hypothetical protein
MLTMIKQPPGRKSSASLSVVPAFEHPRPEPPDRLPEEGKQLWRETTAALRADWFQGCETLLEAYVQAALQTRELGDLLRKFSPRGTIYPDVLRLYCLAVNTLAGLATKLRLTPQSSRDSRVIKHVSAMPKPWESVERTEQSERPSGENRWNWPAPGTPEPEPPAA